jgi:hypothetical protein
MRYTCSLCGADLEACQPAKTCSNRCRQQLHRWRHGKPIGATVHGTNADLIRRVKRLYLRQDDLLIADVTHGNGAFWRKSGERRILRSDMDPLRGIDLVADFRALPYASGSLDVIVLDPPYVHDPTAARPIAASTTALRLRVVWTMPRSSRFTGRGSQRPGACCARADRPGSKPKTRSRAEPRCGRTSRSIRLPWHSGSVSATYSC